MLVIFSRLELRSEDRRWLEEFRSEHDPQHALVQAHFTFVFPFAGEVCADLLAHVATVAMSTTVIHFRLSGAAAVRDPLSPSSHAFILPSEGGAEMRILHGRLYSDFLAAELRHDIPYTPHVTVGRFHEHAAAEHAVIELGVFDVPGRLVSLEIGELGENRLVGLDSFPFSP